MSDYQKASALADNDTGTTHEDGYGLLSDDDLPVSADEKKAHDGAMKGGDDLGISLSGDEGDSDAISSEPEVSDVARQLLLSKAPKITMEFEGIVYTMFRQYEGAPSEVEEELGDQIYVLDDISSVHKGFDQLLGSIREFLQKSCGPLKFSAKEVQLSFEALDLVVSEDNAYSKDISMNDVVSIFKMLRENSLKQQESNVPSSIHTVVKLVPRFVSKYNHLVELVDNNATFENVRGFSNDIQNPFVLDSNESESSNNQDAAMSLSGDASEDLLEILDESSDE